MPLYNPSSAYGGSWGLAAQWTYASDVPQVDFANLGSFSDLLIFTNAITKSVSGETGIRFSVDNGSSFLAGASDYETLTNAGVVGLGNAFGLHGTAATASRGAACQVIGSNINGIYKPVMRVTRPTDGLSCRFLGSTSPINAVRVLPLGGGNITGGSIQIFAR